MSATPIRVFTALPIESLARTSLTARARAIGQFAGATKGNSDIMGNTAR